MSIRDDILDAARSRAGLTYRLDPPPDGVTTTDCSLLVVDSARDAGAALPPGVRTAEQIRQACIPIEQDDVKPGDLLFFEGTYDAAGPAGADGHIASHIGFSLGRGTGQMIDAHERQGDDVAVTNIRTDYWSPKLFDFRRLPALANEAPNNSQNIPTLNVPGIDISNHQGHIEWPQVAARGARFAMMKATESNDFLDEYLAYNWPQAKAAGLIRGAYHFARPEYGNTAESEATYFLRALERNGGAQAGDLLVLDLEPTQPVNGIRAWVLEWLQRVTDRSGVRPMVYTGSWVINGQGLSTVRELAAYGLWLAAYQSSMPPVPAPWSEIAVWQYSDAGSVPGISGNVDMNWSSLEMLKRYAKGGAAVPETTYAKDGDVGSGILTLMQEDGTAPAMPSTFLPLGRAPALIEECQGLNGTQYRWHLPSGKAWRFPAA